MEKLGADRNKISKISNLSKCPFLFNLNLYKNNLESVDLSENRRLHFLELSSNIIQRLDLTGNPELRRVSVADNNLCSLDVSQNKRLKFLDAFKNSISELDLSGCLSLKSALLPDNNLRQTWCPYGDKSVVTDNWAVHEMLLFQDDPSEGVDFESEFLTKKIEKTKTTSKGRGSVKSRAASGDKTSSKVRAAAPAAGKMERASSDRIYLNIPHADKEIAKRLGATWDLGAKLWRAPAGVDLAPFKAWLPEVPLRPENSPDPAGEFKRVLENRGFMVNAVEMDGEAHRVPVRVPDGAGQEGEYSARLGERPSGRLRNLNTGEEVEWFFTNNVLSDEQAEVLSLEAKAYKQSRFEHPDAKAEALMSEHADSRASDLPSHFYLAWKNIKAPDGVLCCGRPGGESLMVPCSIPKLLVSGHVTVTLRDIMFIPNNLSEPYHLNPANKIGASFLLQSSDKDKKLDQQCRQWKEAGASRLPRPTLLISPDFASTKSLHDATGLPVACSLGSDNLVAAATNLRLAYPEANLVICSERILGPSEKLGLNSEARLAAAAVGAPVFVPGFTKRQKELGMRSFNDLVNDCGPETVGARLKNALDNIGRPYLKYVSEDLHYFVSDLPAKAKPMPEKTGQGMFGISR